MTSRTTVLWLSSMLVLGIAASGMAQEATVEYVRDIKPILRARCYACHGDLKQEADLRLDTGAMIRNGNSTLSSLIERVAAVDESKRMPPEGSPLSATQVDLMRAWIRQGAPSPEDEQPDQDARRHWSFQPPVRPEVPGLLDSSHSHGNGFNPIDAFLAEQRVAVRVQPMPPADRGTLLRRLYLDLVGLPPSADELQEFIRDESDMPYENVVDALLESPEHGERWARHWMDVWRYSDWYGRRAVPDVMNSYPMVWRWRDWIVRSVNENKPYDQMIVEMLAADELMPGDDQNTVATGFLVRSWFKWNYETWKKDLVEHTGKAFLGLTLNCAQCHNHKFDPIAQEEYFRFRAFFEPMELRHDRIRGEADPGPFVKYVYALSYGPINSGMVSVFDENLLAETYMFSKGDSRLRIEGKPPVSPGVPSVLGCDQMQLEHIQLPIGVAYPGMKEFVRAEERAKRSKALAAVEIELADSSHGLEKPAAAMRDARWQAAQLELASLQQRIEADTVRYSTGLLSEDRQNEPAVKAMIHAACQAERMAAVASAQSLLVSAEYAIATAEAKLAEATKLVEQVAIDSASKALQSAKKQQATAVASLHSANEALSKELGEYTPLSPKYPQVTSGRRASLAGLIASKDNPLTARVAVNHIWLRHFGQALVDSTQDFGRNGSRPTHPKLLDWLACELMDSGWSMKHIHRLIVTSQSYRMASTTPRSLQQTNSDATHASVIDPDNKSYWRFPTSRMQAEVVRDSLLALSGELDLTKGGHEIDHKQGMTSRRRSLYFAHHGEEKMEFLELFDGASACDCYARTSSVQPQQALALINSDLTKSLSRQLEKRLWKLVSSEKSESNVLDMHDRFIRIAFLQVLNREPREQELMASQQFLGDQMSRLRGFSGVSFSGVSFNGVSSEFAPDERARENLLHALMNHNDFVTIR